MASTPPLFLDPNKPIAQSLAIFASSSSSTTPNSFRVLHHFSYELSKLSVDELTKLCKSVKICSSGRKLLKIQTYVFWLCQLPTTGLILKELQTFNSQIIKEGHRLGQDEIQILARYLHELQIPQITKRKVGRPLKRPLFMTTSTTPMSLSHASPTKKLAFSSRITGMMTIPSISTTTTTTTTTTTSPTFSTSTAPTKSTKSSTKNSPLTPLDTFIRNPCPSIFHSPIVWKGAVLPWELIQYQLEPFYSWHSSLAGRQLSLGDTNLHLLKFELSEKDVRLLSADDSFCLVFFFTSLSGAFLSTLSNTPSDSPQPKSKLILNPIKYKCDSNNFIIDCHDPTYTYHPLDLTSSYALTPGQHFFHFKLLQATFREPEICVLGIVKKISIPEIVQSIKNYKTLSKEQRVLQLKSKAREQWPSFNIYSGQKEKEDEMDGISMHMIKFALTDPWSGVRIELPARSLHCDHVECFDLSTYLWIAEKKKQFPCPFCHGTFDRLDSCIGVSPLSSIYIDLFFLEALNITPITSSHAEFDPILGQFILPIHPSDSHSFKTNTTREIIVLSDTSVSDDDDDDDELGIVEV